MNTLIQTFGVLLFTTSLYAESFTGTPSINNDIPKNGDRGLAPPPIILDYDASTYDSLQGRTYRGNLYRDGVYDTTGPATLTGEKWAFDLGGAGTGSPVALDDTIYIAGGKYFYALDTLTGQEKWRCSIGPSNSTATIVENTAYIGSKKGVHALDITTGDIIWSNKKLRHSNTATGFAYGLVFMQATGIDATTGTIAWGYKGMLQKIKESKYPSSVAITQDYIALNAKSIIQLATGYGRFFDWEGPNTPAISTQTTIGITSAAGGGNEKALLYHNQLSDRAVLYKAEIAYDVPSTTRVICFCSPAVWNNAIYVGAAHKKMTQFDQTTGKPGWRFEATSALNSAPSIASKNGLLYFGSDDGTVYSVQTTDGSKAWEYKIKGKITTSPCIADNIVYISSDDGVLYALH